MGTYGNGQCFFPLTSLQIGDLQSYLSHLSIFLPPQSRKFYILVDNQPWKNLDSRAAHLWQLMVTKSRLSPFANSKVRQKREDFGKRFDSKSFSRSSTSKVNKFERWFQLIEAATLSRKHALLPVKKLKNSLLSSHDLHRTLYGFIVFEVAWADVRGINYLNELQTDTSMAIEAKFMKRWEFDSIQQAAASVSAWFSGTGSEQILLQEYLSSIIGEVFYDAQECSSRIDPNDSGESTCVDNRCAEDECLGDPGGNFNVFPANAEYRTTTYHTPSSSTGLNKRRKITKCNGEVGEFSWKTHCEIGSSPKDTGTSISASSSDSENAVEATQYRDVLILFKFDDPYLPFKLRPIIMSDLRLLTLLESGLPSWVIFLQSYPVFCKLYRPWMCPLARALYVLVSVVTVLIGFYDLYKNVPLVKATVSRLCGPLVDWVDSWEMISRIKYLGTMLFLHNFEKAIKWFLMISRAIRSCISVLTKPMVGPLVEILSFLLPIWNTCLQLAASFCSVFWVAISSFSSLVVDLGVILFFPVQLILSFTWSIGSSILYPIFWAIWEILYIPIRLVLLIGNFISFVHSCTYAFVGEIWLVLSSIFRSSPSSEISMWRSLWNDLFYQVFHAIRSIVNGFVAFFAICNRHRLSIYNHMLEFFRQLSCLSQRSRSRGSSHYGQTCGVQHSLNARNNHAKRSQNKKARLRRARRDIQIDDRSSPPCLDWRASQQYLVWLHEEYTDAFTSPKAVGGDTAVSLVRTLYNGQQGTTRTNAYNFQKDSQESEHRGKTEAAPLALHVLSGFFEISSVV
ncbi:hypothetical protein NE237_000210 [Protea cynaroides]|uniref:Uncharacterized protein n=1 Tax=Protea cynaroides TaxID=273540 RepID=A0A9Q0QX97_9MAGN|nr:hypothetical protein NE237_000210 [Protea cynaroides]